MEPPKISVIFVTNRKGYGEILDDNIARQTFRDFEVIIADDNYENKYGITSKRFKPRQKNEGDAWNLNKAYNDAIAKAQGELLVFLQDFIWIPDDGLQKFWDIYQKYPTAWVTGVGNKAEHGLEGISEPDRRMEGPQGVHMIDHWQVPWEMNWASAPRKDFPKFDERMDAFYGGENLYISHKAALEGAMFFIDRTNQCIGYSQAECGGRPANWEELHCNKNGRLAAFIKSLDILHGK